MLTGKEIAFVGAGSLTWSLLGGLVGGGGLAAEQVVVTNRSSEERLREVRDRWGVRVTRDMAVLGRADVLVLACKPADIPGALRQLAPVLSPRQLIVSAAAGVTTGLIERFLPAGTPVVRAMPNTSSRVRQSATALCAGRWAGPEEMALAAAIFSAVGRVVVVPEEVMDAVTAVSGSGPAYVYLLMEALAEAARAVGLPAETADELVLQTVYGAARMALETGVPPAELRRQVTSPRGTTAAALAVLEERGFREALAAAVQRAAARARELAAEVAALAAEGPGGRTEAGRA